jgi:signal transduction histidine kinase
MEELFSEEGQIVNIILIAIGLLVFMAFSIVLFFYYSRKKIIKTELEKATLEIEHQKEVIQANLITQEAERKRIAQDLHDAISSKLNVVSLNANILTESGISSEETNKIGQSIVDVTSTVLENSRRIAHDLLPPTLEKFGLEAALEELCDEIQETKKFEVNQLFSYVDGQIDKSNELHVFRIAQELFNNAIKYSEATHLDLRLETNQNVVYLRYKDDGVGFNLEQARQAKGIGMSGVENRVAILNGTLDMETTIGNGLTVTIAIP